MCDYILLPKSKGGQQALTGECWNREMEDTRIKQSMSLTKEESSGYWNHCGRWDRSMLGRGEEKDDKIKIGL